MKIQIEASDNTSETIAQLSFEAGELVFRPVTDGVAGVKLFGIEKAQEPDEFSIWFNRDKTGDEPGKLYVYERGSDTPLYVALIPAALASDIGTDRRVYSVTKRAVQ